MENLLHLLNHNSVPQTSSSEAAVDLEDEIIPEPSNYPPAAEALDNQEEFDAQAEEVLAQENDWSD